MAHYRIKEMGKEVTNNVEEMSLDELIGILNEDDNEDILSTFAKLLESDLK